ncbi:unnamed protein product [Albugo candida]|uniref:DNA-directed RNA polymerase subunit n=1 Tax=Albugo candida TaxID=65357 RepID=A0A024FU80_9STRA|nr:unnamed protein product [Albugo candida]|eukprot:CCI10467.1 unnamed protein product [Albugo candida]
MEFFTGRHNNGPSFCPHCGSIFTLPEINNITCSACAYHCKYEDLPSLVSITKSEQKPVPEWLEKEQKIKRVEGPARATVEETCPKCGNSEMEYYTLQMRSADEGQTVFYECKKCGTKSSVNN